MSSLGNSHTGRSASVINTAPDAAGLEILPLSRTAVGDVICYGRWKCVAAQLSTCPVPSSAPWTIFRLDLIRCRRYLLALRASCGIRHPNLLRRLPLLCVPGCRGSLLLLLKSGSLIFDEASRRHGITT